MPRERSAPSFGIWAPLKTRSHCRGWTIPGVAGTTLRVSPNHRLLRARPTKS
jgi:hypothetical protein